MRRQVFIVWFVIFLTWAFYRANVFLPEWVDELVVKPIIFVYPVVIIALVYEKKKLRELGFFSTLRGFFLDLYIGVVFGIVFALQGLLANYLKYGQFSFSPLLPMGTSWGIVWFLILNLVTSLWEEILARGYLYQRLYEATKNQFWSAVSSTFLFFLLHVPILFTRLNLTGVSLFLYPTTVMLLGITNCYVFSLRKSLTLPILIHTFWNMTVALYL